MLPRFTTCFGRAVSGSSRSRLNGFLKVSTIHTTRRCGLSTRGPPEKFKSFAVVEPGKLLATQITLLEKVKQKGAPYWYLARLDKPIGTVLLLLPCTWSITMASYATAASPSILASNLLLFGAGAVIMRGAGCTINDLWDRNLDKGVERTRVRPLASGALTVPQAIGFLGIQLAGGLCILTQLNWYSIGLGASSLGLVALYPLMKRITHWPQFVLGLTFNWGALLGWSAVTGVVNWSVCGPLYASGILWTLVYDTAYAHQDKRDDAVMGIKSTALLFGEHTKAILSVFLVSSALLAAWAGIENTQGIPFFSSLLVGTAMLGVKLRSVDFNIPAQGGQYFRYCGYFGWLIFAGALLDWVMLKSSGVASKELANGPVALVSSKKEE